MNKKNAFRWYIKFQASTKNKYVLGMTSFFLKSNSCSLLAKFLREESTFWMFFFYLQYFLSEIFLVASKNEFEFIFALKNICIFYAKWVNKFWVHLKVAISSIFVNYYPHLSWKIKIMVFTKKLLSVLFVFRCEFQQNWGNRILQYLNIFIKIKVYTFHVINLRYQKVNLQLTCFSSFCK